MKKFIILRALSTMLIVTTFLWASIILPHEPKNLLTIWMPGITFFVLFLEIRSFVNKDKKLSKLYEMQKTGTPVDWKVNSRLFQSEIMSTPGHIVTFILMFLAWIYLVTGLSRVSDASLLEAIITMAIIIPNAILLFVSDPSLHLQYEKDSYIITDKEMYSLLPENLQKKCHSDIVDHWSWLETTVDYIISKKDGISDDKKGEFIALYLSAEIEDVEKTLQKIEKNFYENRHIIGNEREFFKKIATRVVA